MSIAIIKGLKYLKDFNEQKKREILYKYTPADSDFLILDKLITESIQEYQILKLETDKYAYVTEKVQKDMFSYIVRKVLYRMSPIYREKLGFIYNMDNINDIITNRINIAIIDFAVEINSNINSEEQKNKRDSLD